VRELETVIERALILNRNGTLDIDNFLQPGDYKDAYVFEPERSFRSLNDSMADHIRRALKESDGKVHGPGGAADLLGINPSTLRNKMNRLGIDFGRSAVKKNK
jgi:DNA-binding NtrC family response regulator